MKGTPEERFWAKVRKSDGCWEWTGARFHQDRTRRLSYGMFSLSRKILPAHRAGWILANGPIPDGLLVLHHCDNRPCVRLDHLYLGTHADNMRDARVRRRMASGGAAASAKLSEADLPLIRALHARGIATEKIGPLFDVSGRTIRFVIRREHWKYAAD